MQWKADNALFFWTSPLLCRSWCPGDMWRFKNRTCTHTHTHTCHHADVGLKLKLKQLSQLFDTYLCERVFDPGRKKRLIHTNPKERKMCQDQRFDKTHLGKCIRAQFSAKIYFNLNFVRTGLSIWSTLFAGGMAGICNWLVAIPMDVVKSRLQVRAVIIIMSVIMLTMMIRIRSCLAWQDWIQAAPEGTYTGAIDVLKQLLKNEGPVALYKGCVPILLRSISSSDEA